jgi:hypothetical protein
MEGKTMHDKKAQVAPKQHGRRPLQGAVPTTFGALRSRQRFVADLRRIVSVAHLLSAEVAPPARVWRSLRAQLEKEGIVSRSVTGRLEDHTRFPMFRN